MSYGNVIFRDQARELFDILFRKYTHMHKLIPTYTYTFHLLKELTKHLGLGLKGLYDHFLPFKVKDI